MKSLPVDPSKSSQNEPLDPPSHPHLQPRWEIVWTILALISLIIYGGSGVVNDAGLSKDFTYYGLPSNTSLALSANASFTGYINAPSADFGLGGGGNNTYDFVGACLVKSVVMNGHFNFHYDESLVNTPLPSGYAVISWDEL